jgi:Trk-type K+ transport system membrane component
MFVRIPLHQHTIFSLSRDKTDSRITIYSIVYPVFLAGIFTASNGRFKIAYTDALFVCVSAVTGTGLTTVDLSSLTAWQQTILVILELTGNQVRRCIRYVWNAI